MAAVGVVVDYLIGFALAEASGALGEPDEQREMLEMLNIRPQGELPAMRRTLEALPGEDLRTDFEFGLEVVLTGLEESHRATRPMSRSLVLPPVPPAHRLIPPEVKRA